MSVENEKQSLILKLVKEKDYEEIFECLDKKQIRKFPGDYTGRLLFELFPVNEKMTRKLAAMLLEYGNWDWLQKDENGELLHTSIIRNGQAALAVKAVRRLKKKDAHNRELAFIWKDLLLYFLEKQQREGADIMLKKNVLRYMGQEGQKEVLQKILAYKDEQFLHRAVKSVKKIPADIIAEPESLADLQFTKEFLNRYAKYIDMEKSEEKLWKITAMCDADSMAKHMLHRKKHYEFLPVLAENGKALFDLLLHIPARSIPDELKKQVFFAALRSDEWRKRYSRLEKKGWKKSSSGRKKKIEIADEYIKILEEKKYPGGRKGHLEQINDKARLRFLKSTEQK